MKYNLKAIMIRAWEIKKENNQNVFAICLKMAWMEAKEISKSIYKSNLKGMMTFKQKKFIFKLMKEVEKLGVKFNPDKELFYAGNGYDTYRTTKAEASRDIEYLLNLKRIAA